MKTILITGINGFVGGWLSEYLVSISTDYQLHGTIRKNSNLERVNHLKNHIELHYCDLTDADAVRKLITSIKPNEIYHLAGESSVVDSWNSPLTMIYNNISSQINIFESVRDMNYPCKILVVGSSEEYGNVLFEHLPIKEIERLQPLSPYAVTKAAQDMFGYQYYESYGMHILRVRSFNHTGPHRDPKFAISGFCKKIAEIELKKSEPVLKTGSLNVSRDFTDVRDVVKAYAIVMEKGKSGEVYNVCSNKLYKLSKILEMIVSFIPQTVEIIEDPDKMRPSDIKEIYGDNKQLRELGWNPSIPFEKTIKDIYEYWYEKICLEI